MKNYILSTSMLMALASCGGSDADKKLDAVITRLDNLEKKIDAMPARITGGAHPAQQRQGLDPGTVYPVKVEDDDPFVGAKDAKVTIVEAYEYGCPYCKMAADVMDEVVKTHAHDVKVVGKQFVVHPQIATNASLAACAAQKQSKYGAFSTALWHSAWSQEGRLDASKLAPEAIEETAKGIGLDVNKLKADMKGCAERIDRGQRELAQLGVNGTPTFFINGRPYAGPRTVEGFNAAIDAELKRGR